MILPMKKKGIEQVEEELKRRSYELSDQLRRRYLRKKGIYVDPATSISVEREPSSRSEGYDSENDSQGGKVIQLPNTARSDLSVKVEGYDTIHLAEGEIIIKANMELVEGIRYVIEQLEKKYGESREFPNKMENLQTLLRTVDLDMVTAKHYISMIKEFFDI
ncbi:hypothetical protein ACFL6I_09625 [candidate division KSB1 bacterium]